MYTCKVKKGILLLFLLLRESQIKKWQFTLIPAIQRQPLQQFLPLCLRALEHQHSCLPAITYPTTIPSPFIHNLKVQLILDIRYILKPCPIQKCIYGGASGLDKCHKTRFLAWLSISPIFCCYKLVNVFCPLEATFVKRLHCTFSR